MIEYLNPEDWSLHVIDGEYKAVPENWILVPEGADRYIQGTKYKHRFGFLKDGLFYDGEWITHIDKVHEYIVVWQRELKSEVVEKKHNHYFKDVSNLNEIDVYRVLDLFAVEHPCLQHAVKKLLCAGQRGSKGRDKDIQEAIDTLVGFQDMRKEDNNG